MLLLLIIVTSLLLLIYLLPLSWLPGLSLSPLPSPSPLSPLPLPSPLSFSPLPLPPSRSLCHQEVVTDQHRMKYERVKEQIAFMTKVMNSLLQIGQNFEERTRTFGEDMRQFSKELTYVCYYNYIHQLS